MNGIAFAGYAESSAELRAEKYFKIVVPQGKCAVEFADGKTEPNEGQIAVIPPQLKHAVRGNAICVCLEQALLPFKEIRLVRDDKNAGIAHAAEQAVEHFSAKNSTRSGILAALGTLIVAYVTAFAGRENLSPVVETVRGEVQKNISTPSFSLEDTIKKLPLNYDYVRKLFKRETGVTPHEYLNELRMKRAQKLILGGVSNSYSNYTVSQIAEACGFAEPLYFSRVFKQRFGQSPMQYLKNNGKAE